MEDEKYGTQGREMTYKERKAAETKKKEATKQAKADEDDREFIPSKCKECNAEIVDFARWDPRSRRNQNAPPADR